MYVSIQDMIILTIDGLPIPWTPSRITRTRHAFNPKYREKEYAQWQIQAQWNQAKISAPVELDITFHMPIPSGTSKIKKTQMLNGIIRHIKRPDVDNLSKFAIDCIKGIVLDDDNQVFKLSAEKIYGLVPKTVIKIII